MTIFMLTNTSMYSIIVMVNHTMHGGIAMTRDFINASTIMRSIVPITRFNRGEANKIFDEVESSGMKIVVKINKPACVLLSPARYDEIMELLSDHILLQEAEKRMASTDSSELLTQDEMMAELGVTQEDLDDIDVEID